MGLSLLPMNSNVKSLILNDHYNLRNRVYLVFLNIVNIYLKYNIKYLIENYFKTNNSYTDLFLKN